MGQRLKRFVVRGPWSSIGLDHIGWDDWNVRQSRRALRDSGRLNFSRPFIPAFLLEFLSQSRAALAVQKA